METATHTAEKKAHVSASRFMRLFSWLHWRTFLASTRKTRRESPLLIFVLSGFVTSYLIFGFWMFKSGLKFIYKVPLIGNLLADRVLFLIFAFFFVMLIVSNVIIGYATLFKNRESEWFLSLPIRHRDVYRWKFVEALVVSSWALIFLSAPMLTAYGVVHKVPWYFYIQVALGYLPFVIIPAVLGSWLIILLVRALSRPWVKIVLISATLIGVTTLIVSIKPVTEADATATQESLLFPKLMKGTRLATNELLPSSWLAEAVGKWRDGLWQQGLFYFLLLLSYALMGLLVSFAIAGRLYYGSWTAALNSKAAKQQRIAEGKRLQTRQRSLLNWTETRLRSFSPPTVALIFKDIRIFWRDPAQWSQFMIFFGLLTIYVINLRNVVFEFKSAYWETLISYLNLSASALTLSTLTTRFVYPMFSLEGRRIWILGLSPIGLQKVVLQKFWMSFIVSALITLVLMIASSLMLRQDWPRVVYFAGAIILMSAALSGLSAGLGALFPNFKEDNPSKIVSSFGGTLCLVVSFVYNTLFVAMLAVPDILRIKSPEFTLPPWVTISGAIMLSLLVAIFPMSLALRRVKSLEM